MRVNRRTALIGVGGLVAGGGALLGSGAFSQIEANRTVTVDIAGDQAAFLQLGPADAEYDEFFDYVDNVLEINLGGLAATNADGLNDDAVTAFDAVLEITNEGTQEITLTVDEDGEGVSLYHGGFPGTDSTGGVNATIASGGSEEFGIAVDTGMNATFPDGTIADGESVELTIVAEA